MNIQRGSVYVLKDLHFENLNSILNSINLIFKNHTYPTPTGKNPNSTHNRKKLRVYSTRRENVWANSIPDSSSMQTKFKLFYARITIFIYLFLDIILNFYKKNYFHIIKLPNPYI